MSLLDAQLRGQHALRGRLRAEHRRARRRARRRAAGRLVLLRQRRPGSRRGGRHERAPGRPHLVGSPRLEPDRGGARGRRLVSRAVPQRHRRQAAAGARRMRPVAERRVPDGRPTGCARSGVPAAIAARGSGGGPNTLRVLVGPWSDRRGRPRGPDASTGGPRASGVYARFASGGRSLTLLDADGRAGAHAGRRRGPDRGHPRRRTGGARLGRHRHRRGAAWSWPRGRSTVRRCAPLRRRRRRQATRCRCPQGADERAPGGARPLGYRRRREPAARRPRRAWAHCGRSRSWPRRCCSNTRCCSRCCCGGARARGPARASAAQLRARCAAPRSW